MFVYMCDIGSVGCWVSMIMVEQLIYNATKRMDWTHWAIACAVAHGGGTWTMHLIGCGIPSPTKLHYAIRLCVCAHQCVNDDDDDDRRINMASTC